MAAFGAVLGRARWTMTVLLTLIDSPDCICSDQTRVNRPIVGPYREQCQRYGDVAENNAVCPLFNHGRHLRYTLA